MDDQWEIDGPAYSNCVCDWGCPCQFNAPSTYGRCEAIVAGRIDAGHFNQTRLDGLSWVLLAAWPGEIKDGGGTQQVIIDVRADEAQREGLRKILHGESTEPGATHFFVYNAMCETVLETLYLPIELTIDLSAGTADLTVEGIVSSTGRPIINSFTGKEVQAGIHRPDGFEYRYARMGNGNATAEGAIELDFKDSYAHYNRLYMNQDGVIDHPVPSFT